MIPLRDITECDHCGVCCTQSPCLLGSFKEFRAIEKRFPNAKQHIAVEVEPSGKHIVRVSGERPCRYFDGQCTIQDIKPTGGREFKCWDSKTYEKTYHWTPNQLRKLGFAA